MIRNALAGLAAILLTALPVHAQTKPTLTPADYGKWETLAGFRLSPAAPGSR